MECVLEIGKGRFADGGITRYRQLQRDAVLCRTPVRRPDRRSGELSADELGQPGGTKRHRQHGRSLAEQA
jgi:hypothetical protein